MNFKLISAFKSKNSDETYRNPYEYNSSAPSYSYSSPQINDQQVRSIQTYSAPFNPQSSPEVTNLAPFNPQPSLVETYSAPLNPQPSFIHQPSPVEPIGPLQPMAIETGIILLILAHLKNFFLID